MSAPSHDVTCPCCGATLTVDAATGAILSHSAPPRKSNLSFEDAFHQVEEGKKRAETRFDRAMEERGHQSEILDKKFRKALEKAAEEPAGPPDKPFDLD